MIALAGFLLSMFTKILADLLLHTPLPILGSWIGLHYALNPGIAFGVVLPPLLQPILISCAFIAILFWSHRWLLRPLCCIGAGCVLGGGAANIVDRLGDGLVTDFIVLWPFPLFNVADTLIALGVLPFLFQKPLAVPPGKW